MNCKIIALLVVLCAVSGNGSILEGLVRAVARRACPPLCAAGCVVTSDGIAATACIMGCRTVCSRVKRDAIRFFEDGFKVIVPLPRDFTLYDTDEDGFIQLEEFAEFLLTEPSRAGVIKAFNLADSNDDSLISEVEFQRAPWLFEQVDEGENVIGDDEE